ncbi:hypothetical protein BGX23_003482 [Mortierella sp. AD031]|nr:hypothetical protein BGX23_003482 [Mortierella sp. AD031]KAG0207083.1 hypothetical protein BGX33_007041 [Mortierella sp. NVP41]
MTGDEAYHADCFRCTQCDSKIDDLVFAKTSQGIYCMKCHQERKEAKRQREERERMGRAERMMEKLLPTIPEGEKPSAASSYRNQSIEKHQQHTGLPFSGFSHSTNDMPRYPQPKLPSHEPLSNGSYGASGSVFTPSTRPDSRPKPSGPSLPCVDVGPPLLPPLTFGLDDIVSGGFDLGDMLGTSGPKDNSQNSSTINSPVPSAKEEEIVKGSDRSSYRLSISRASARLSMSSPTSSEKSSAEDESKTLSDIPEGTAVETPLLSLPDDATEDEGMTLSQAMSLVRELRMEVAKHNPTSPLLYGTPQLQFGLLKEKVDRLTQKHAELEKSIRDLYIEKDLLGMDLEAMNEELAAKEEALAANNADSLKPRPVTHNFRMSTSHDLMKQSYQMEVKALQDQKEQLQQEIQTFVEQRDQVLDEMQILSVRNAELSTMNNDMMREIQGRKDAKAAPAAPSSTFNAGMLTSFTGKMRRQRQMSGGSQQELKAQSLVAGSNESTLSFVSTNSDGTSRSLQGSKSKKEERQEDIFGEEIVAPKKFNWKKGTMNTMNTGVNTVKNVGAMFGKLIVEGAGGQEAPPANGRVAPMLSDNGSSNGQILPPTRSFSAGSDSRSLNGQYTEQHFFIQHNYIKPARCDCCDDKVWGREYKCRGCGFQIHGRCSHEIVPGCSGRYKDSDSSSVRNLTPSGESGHGLPPPPSSPKQVMFGNSLLDQLEVEQRTIPMVVEKCIEAVDERGLEIEGIYRRSGMAVEARQLVQAFDAGLNPNLMDTAVYQDICSITSVLKQYLRTLPEPLVPYDLYGEFMEATCLPHTDEKYDIFKELMDRMPIAHYQTMKVLMEHLNRVTERDNINLMTSKNLSVVFGPTLMRNPDQSREILDMTSKNMTIEFLIVNTHALFVRVEKTSSNGHGQGSNGSSTLTVTGADGFPVGFTGQRQGSHGSLGQMIPPPRRAPNHAGHPTAPFLPPRSSSGEAIPTVSQGQQPQHYQQQQQQQQQYNGHLKYQQQQQQQQQQVYRPQQFQQPQQHHPTLQQLKQQQQQREQYQRDQQQLQQQQQQLQLQQKHQTREQEHDGEQEQEQEQDESEAVVPSSPSSASTQPSSPLPTLSLSLAQQQQQQQQQQRQQVNPEIDMTHFP